MQNLPIILFCIIVVAAGIWFILRIFLPLRELDKKFQKMKDEKTEYPKRNLDIVSVIKEMNIMIEVREEELKKEHTRILLEQQMRYTQLQNQINPHFLYNTLENIRGQAIIENQNRIAEMTEALARFFRYNISKDNDIVHLSQELENIKTYVQIQQYRFLDRFSFEIVNHDDTGVALNCKIPKMTLQPIVENSIFHGVERKVESGKIQVHIEVSSEHVVILVQDDGVGMDRDTLTGLREKIRVPLKDKDMIDGFREAEDEGETKGHGIAMKNINTRLHLLYGESCGLNISSTKNVGTEVELVLPLVTEEGISR